MRPQELLRQVEQLPQSLQLLQRLLLVGLQILYLIPRLILQQRLRTLQVELLRQVGQLPRSILQLQRLLRVRLQLQYLTQLLSLLQRLLILQVSLQRLRTIQLLLIPLHMILRLKQVGLLASQILQVEAQIHRLTHSL